MTAQPHHTTGPWEATRMLLSPKARDRRSGFVINTEWEDDGIPPMSVRICDMRASQAVGFSELLANAHLIAAAPDLLAALECLVAADNCNYMTETMRYEGYFDAARAAIAKARTQEGE